MPARRGIVLLLISAAVLLSAAPADAYDHKHTHRWLTRQAAQLLVQAYPGQYDELLEYIDEVAAGAEHEDDLFVDGDNDPQTLRVMRHFYRPVDGAGLSMYGQTFPTSYQWAIEGSEANEWDWNDGMVAWRAGDRDEAYFVLGHVVHLIQDLTVPAHTHLDVHGPPSGDDYETYCTRQMIDELSSNLPLPPAGAAIPEFDSAYQAWQATALASYHRTLYPGRIIGTERVEGVLAGMFPALHWSWFSENWTISDPPVGDLDEDFFEDEPGYFYFKNAEHPAAIDRVGFDVNDPAAAQFVANADGATMTELMARDLVPIAVLHTAGVMKLYLDEAHAQRPDPEPPVEQQDESSGCGVAARARGGGFGCSLPILLVLFAIRRRKV